MESKDYHDFFPNEPEVLSFGGGSYKTGCFLGALHYLNYQKKIVFSNVQIFQGASAGAIIALALNLGMKPNTLMYYLFKTNIMAEFRKDIHTKFVEKIVFEGTFMGFTKGNSLMKKISNIFSNNFSGWYDAITFEELYEKTNQKLFITATNISKRKLVHFNHGNYPKLPVLLAIRMSIGIPFIFESYKFEDEFYVDGDMFGFDLIKELNIEKGKKILRFKHEKGDKESDLNKGDENIDSVFKKLIYYYKENTFHKKKEILLNMETNDISTFFMECNLKSVLRFEEKNFTDLYLSGIFQTMNFNKKRNKELSMNSNFF